MRYGTCSSLCDCCCRYCQKTWDDCDCGGGDPDLSPEDLSDRCAPASVEENAEGAWLRLTHEAARVRGIVRRAAERSKVPFVKAWLRDDPHGKWEVRVVELLKEARSHPMFPTMSDDAVDQEVATMLSYLAVTALLREKRKK